MMRFGFLLVLLPALGLPLSAAKKKFDERGNVISGTEAKDTTVAAPGSGESVPPAATDAAPAKTPVESTEGAVKPAVAPAAANDAAEAAREEAELLAQQKHPLTKVYLENAHMYLRSNRTDKALEFLKKSQEAGEDEFSREARLQSLWLRARKGDSGLEGEAEGFDEKIRTTALLRIADGYYACAKEQPMVQGSPGSAGSQAGEPVGRSRGSVCLTDSERVYAYISELQPRSTDGKLARLRLGLLLVETGRLEAALPHLAKTLMAEGMDPRTGQSPDATQRPMRELPLDRAWFNLAQLYERPWYHRDTHKAAAAYKQVLKYSGSPYQQVARERLNYLERFGTGYSRP